MPQLNPDDAANDEPKTYKDEAINGEDSNDLNDIKGDLVDEDDGDSMQGSFENKNLNHIEDSKNGALPNQTHDIGKNFAYSPNNSDSVTTGLHRPLFENSFLPPSSQVPYSHCMPPYMGSFFRGGPSPMELDPKQGLPRLPYSDVPPMYPLPGQLGQIPNPLMPWHPSHIHPLCTASAMAGMLRYPYPFHNFTSSGAVRNVSPFPLVPPHRNGIHSNLLSSGHLPLSPHVNGHPNKPLSDKKVMDSARRNRSVEKPKQPYVKKPLNAFMLYMKEQRAKVVAECTLKESAAINQILGRKWHNLDKEEQQKYYDMARKERQLHMQKHPSWSARDNYGKKKKRKKEKSTDCTGPSAKKCRAVFGLEQQQLWCAPCRRKKKCIRYPHDDDDSDDSDSAPQYNDSPPQMNSTPSCGNQSAMNDSNVNQARALEPRLPSSIDVKQERSSPKMVDVRQSCSDSQKSTVSPPADQASCGVGKLREEGPETPRRGFEDSLRHLSNSFSNSGPASNDVRMNRTSSNSETSLSSSSNSGGSRTNLYNSPLLSPSNINLSSPHSNQPLLSNFSYLAAAAGLPPSPLGGLMGFPGFNGLTSPLHMGLNPSGAPVGSVGRISSSDSRLNASALEGRS